MNKLTISKKKIRTYLYVTLLFLWYLSATVCDSTTVNGVYMEIFGSVYRYAWMGIKLLAIWGLITHINKKRSFYYLLLFLVFISDLYTGGSTIMSAVWLILGVRTICDERIIKPVFWGHLVGVIIVILLASSGVIENTTISRGNGIIRQSMGFYHPNTFASHMLMVVMSYFYLRRKNLKLFDSIIMGLITIWTYQLSNSQTSFIIMTAITFICFIYWLSESGLKLIGYMSNSLIKNTRYMAIVVPIVTFILSILIDDTMAPSWTLFSRIIQAGIYLKYYSVNLIGHKLEFNYANSSISNRLYTLDNSYMYLLLQSGLIIFLAFIYFEFKLIKRELNNKDYILVSILILYMIYGFSEALYLKVLFNFSLLFLSNVLFYTENLNN